jgi:hypothetical protein
MKRRVLGSVFVLMSMVGANAAPPAAPVWTLDTLRHFMVGTWDSADDTRLSREFDPDGTAIDRYDGDESATARGTWLLFTGSVAPPEAAHHKLSAEGIYLEVRERGDVLLFAVLGVDSQNLVLGYLERGNTLRFSRLK